MGTTNETTEQKLQAILSEIDDAPLREDIFNRFFLENPLQVAKLLHSLTLPDSVKSKILALRVGMPPAHHGENLEILIEKAAMQMWARLAEDAEKISA